MKLSAISIFIYAFFCCFNLFSSDGVVRIIETTNSAQIVRLNMGEGELKPSDSGLLVAVINQRTSDVKLKKRYLPIAKAFLIKAAPRNSVWVLRDLSRTNTIQKTRKLIKVGASYMLMLKRDFLRGRSKRGVSKLEVISEPGTNRSIDDEEILFRNHKQQLSAITLHLKKWMKNETHQEINLSKWARENSGNLWSNESQRYWSATSTVRSNPDHKLSKIDELNLYEKSLTSYLKKLNDPKMSWEKRVIAKNDYLNSSEGISQEVSKRERELIANQRKIKGIDWSSNYSQEEMRSWVEDNGAINEVGVRENIDRYSLIAAIHGSFGLNLANNELASDFQNRRKFKTSIEGSVEWFLFRTLESYLRKFSIEFGARLALDAVATGAANALSRETSLSTRFLWYPTGPQRMEKNIFFLGTALRFGLANLEVNRTSETGRYNLVGLGFVGGYRYNFSNGFGARVLLSFEKLALQSSQRSESNVHLENRISLSDFRMQIGLSYVF